MEAKTSHQFMKDARQAAEDREHVARLDRILSNTTFGADIVEGLKSEREFRSARLDRFVAEHGWKAIAF